MASYFDEIAKNNLKSDILLLVFLVVYILIIYVFLLFIGFGAGTGTYVFVVGVTVVYALISYFYGGNFVLAVSRAKEADEKQYANFYAAAQGLSSAMQVRMPKLYVMEDPNPNAFATGRKSNPAICATTGLLKMMNRDELDGVIAHEMSHIADNDVQMMTIIVAFGGCIGLIAAFIRHMAWYGLGGRNSRNGGVIVLAALLIGMLAPLFALLIRLALSRRRESLADANGARVIRNPAALASALKKIQAYSASPMAQNVMHANEITASIYFANPFTAKSLLNLFSTHPPIEDRIKALQAMY